MSDSTYQATAGDVLGSGEVNPNSHPIKFSGNTTEYFKIWAVNILLTIVTLGIFSAWAKVRNSRYFYGNTEILGSQFFYHASPLSILVARIIVLAVVIGGAVWAGEDLFRQAEYSLLLVLLLPWAIVRGLSFKVRNTSYRNVRFGFSKNNKVYLSFYLLFLPLILLLLLEWISHFFPNIFNISAIEQIITEINKDANGTTLLLYVLLHFILLALGAAYLAYFYRRYHQLKATCHYWGEHNFTIASSPYSRYFLAIFLPSFCFKLLVAGFIALIYVPIYAILGKLNGGSTSDTSLSSAIIDFLTMNPIVLEIIMYLLVLILVMAIIFIRASLFRLFWASIRLPGEGRVDCQFSTWGLTWLWVSNFLATVLSLYLLAPWAKIRRARYLANRMTIIIDPQHLQDVFSKTGKENALGEELDAIEGFSFDVGLI